MEDRILFKETQRFSQVWVWLILLAINGPALYIAMTRGAGDSNNDARLSSSDLIITTIISILIIVLFLTIRLETIIKDSGVYVRFFPIQMTLRSYPWDNISNAVVRTYNPIAEYGGWGFRMGLFGRGRALNISGNQGLQLVFNDGSKLLIGTQRPEEVDDIIRRAGFNS